VTRISRLLNFTIVILSGARIRAQSKDLALNVHEPLTKRIVQSLRGKILRLRRSTASAQDDILVGAGFFTIAIVLMCGLCCIAQTPPAGTSQPTTQTTAIAATVPTVDARGDTEVLKEIAELDFYPLGQTVSGQVRTVGSSTVSHLLHRWSAEYARLQPNVTIVVGGGSSDDGIPALIDGRVEFAALSRLASPAEVAAFKSRFGYEPSSILVGVDAVAVFVNHTNPLQSISLAKLDALYSRIPKHGGATIDNWGELGLTGEWERMTPVRFGRPPTHGDHALFHSVVLQGGRWRLDIDADPFESSLVQGVGADRAGVGYASITYDTPAVHALTVIGEDGAPYAPTRENSLTHKYPLSRPLLLYFNKPPDKPLSEATLDFGLFVTSQIGQQFAGQAGMFPINRQLAKRITSEAALSSGDRSPRSTKSRVMGRFETPLV